MRTPRTRPSTALAATAVAAIIIAAVAALIAMRLPAAGVPTVPASPASAGLQAPALESNALNFTEEVLIERCMRRAGFRYRATNSQRVPGDRDFPYVLDDARWAAAHGYGSDIDEAINEARRTDPNAIYFRTLTQQQNEAATTALNGAGPTRVEAVLPGGGVVAHNRDGCVATAEGQLYGDFTAWYRVKKVTENLSSLRRGEVVTAPAFRLALQAWSTCMHDHGQPFDTPDDARAALPRPGAPGARTVEMTRAVTEAQCANSSGFAATAHRLDDTARRHVEARYRSVLRTGADMERAARTRAPEILAGR